MTPLTILVPRPERHTYAVIDTPLIGWNEHRTMIGTSSFRCIVEDCDGRHHYYVPCAR